MSPLRLSLSSSRVSGLELSVDAMSQGLRATVENDDPRIVYEGAWVTLSESFCTFSKPDALCYSGGAPLSVGAKILAGRRIDGHRDRHARDRLLLVRGHGGRCCELAQWCFRPSSRADPGLQLVTVRHTCLHLGLIPRQRSLRARRRQHTRQWRCVQVRDPANATR